RNHSWMVGYSETGCSAPIIVEKSPSLKRDPLLADRIKRLRTVPGVGPITALACILDSPFHGCELKCNCRNNIIRGAAVTVIVLLILAVVSTAGATIAAALLLLVTLEYLWSHVVSQSNPPQSVINSAD